MSDPIWTLEALQHHFSALFENLERSNKVLHNSDAEQLERRFQSLEKAIAVAHATAEKAQEVSNNSAEKWRQNANEWRGSMTDRERNFASRSEFDSLKERLDRLEGRGHGMREVWSWIIAAVAIVIAFIGIKFK